MPPSRRRRTRSSLPSPPRAGDLPQRPQQHPSQCPGPASTHNSSRCLGRWKMVWLRNETVWQLLQKLQIKSPGGLQAPSAHTNTIQKGVWEGMCTPQHSQQHSPQQRKHACQQVNNSKTWSFRTLEYCSALDRKAVLTPATPSINLEDVTLSETSQVTAKADRVRPTNTQGPEQPGSETGSRRGAGGETELLMGVVSVLQDGKVLELCCTIM